MNENAKYNIIKKLVDSNGNKRRAAIEINCTVRHINRMIIGYKKKGKNFFVHGNRGVKPAHALPEDTRQNIIDLYLKKVWYSNMIKGKNGLFAKYPKLFSLSKLSYEIIY